MSLKLIPAALLLLAVATFGFGPNLRTADATVVGPLVPSATEVTSGGIITIAIPVGGPDTTESTQIQVTGQSAPMNPPALSGVLVVQECTPACPGDAGKSGTFVSVDEDNLAEIVVGLQLTCSQPWTARVTAEPGEIDEESVLIDCVPAGGGAGHADEREIGMLGVHQVVVSANPNILPCGGGTTTILAEAVDAFGDKIDGLEFRFFSTGVSPSGEVPSTSAGSAGSLVQTSHDTARLTLGPNQPYVRVTASLADFIDIEVDVVTTFVGVDCTGDHTNQTLVVTASPNVIECTGTTTITATVRDRNGHVVPGRGFHFYASAGLLEVHPNNASTEEGRATLTLRPGDGDATVIVSSGLLHGTYEDQNSVEHQYTEGAEDTRRDENTGFVTVQQRCLGTTTGVIQVNASQQYPKCGERVFIGLSVKDVDLQTVVDNTGMTLISDVWFSDQDDAGTLAGGFVSEAGVSPQVGVGTSQGEANVIFVTPRAAGEVTITAASGDLYGYQTLHVSGGACAPVAPPSTGSGTSAAAPAPCTPIGDGVCIAPPSTGGNLITPPSTGSAGMKEACD